MEEVNYLFKKFKEVFDWLKKINENKIFFIISIYIIGIVVILLRNRKEGIPFTDNSFLKCAIISLYFMTFFIIFLLDYFMLVAIKDYKRENNKIFDGQISMFDILENNNKEKKFKKIKSLIKNKIKYIMIIIWQITIILVFAFIFNIIYKKYSSLECFIISAVLINFPILSIIILGKKEKLRYAVVLYISIAFGLVGLIPINMGGVYPLNVVYTDYNTGDSDEMQYFGNSDEMLILKKDGKVCLYSIGSGKIEYNY